jgi:replicative DNA helicase
VNVNEQAILSSEDSTPEDRIQTQLDQTNRYANKLAATVARAIRLQANGQEVDAGQVREQARAIYEQLLEPIQAAPAGRDLLTFSPLDLMAEYWQQQAERRELASTGFASLDQAFSGGLERDRLYVLLGAPGSGKTTWINQICDHVGRERAIFYVTSEDSPLVLLAKTIARRAMIEYNAVRYGWQRERDRINAAFAEYREQPQARHIRYADATQGMSLQDIAEQAVRHFEAVNDSTKGDPVIIIDYLQRLARAEDYHIRASTGGALGADARLAATVYTERLRALACDLHCSVICLSAMSRAGGYSAAADRTLNAAKESGDIEYTADAIMAIGEQVENGVSINLPEPGAFAWAITIAKNRQGSTSATGARIDLTWYPTYQQFVERDDSASDQGETLLSRSNSRYRRRG